MSLLNQVKNRGGLGTSISSPTGSKPTLLSKYVKPLETPAPVAQTPTFGQRLQGIGNTVKNVVSTVANSNVGKIVGRIVNQSGGNPLPVSQGAAQGATKFVAKTAVAGANLFSDTVDYSADFLANVIGDQIKGRDYRVLDPLQVLGKEKRSELADKWKNFYKTNIGNQTEALKEVTRNLNQIPSLQPSEAWSKASIGEKLSPKFLPETVLETGPGIVASLGSFAINPALGFTLAAGSVANNVNELAQKAGVPEDKSLSLGLGTGLLVGYLDKLVPEGILNQEEKQMFIGALAKRVVFSGLKGGATNVGQEGVQLAVESTLRKDLNFDEGKTRLIMAGFTGFLGGAGMQGVVGFINNVKSGDIAAISQEDIKNPEIINKQVEDVTPVQGDASKVAGVSETQNVDTQGKPVEQVKPFTNSEVKQIVYHTTNFNGDLEAGTQFTTDKTLFRNKGDIQREAYIDIQNPYRATTIESVDFNKLKEQGYDGYINKSGKIIVPFDSSQIREIKPIQIVDNTQSGVNKPVQEIPKEQLKIKTNDVELQKINEEKVKNVTDIKSAKNTLRDIQTQLDEAITEAQGKAEVARAQREGLNVEDISKLKRIVATTKAFKEGDIETIRASKHSQLVEDVVNNVRELNPDMTDSEALNYALNLPTKAQESANNPQIRDLQTREKTLSNYIDLLKAKQAEIGLKEDKALSTEWERALVAQEKLQKLIEVPSSQLPVGEGNTKVSKLAARVKGVIGNATPEQIDKLGLQTYNEMNNQDQISKATDYVSQNPEEALKVISGEIEPPKGLLKNSIYVALTEAGRDNTDLATRIATLSSTRLGQEIEILKAIAADNPVVKMQEVIDARIKSYERRTGTKVNERVKAEVEKIKTEVKAPTHEAWSSFLESIKC